MSKTVDATTTKDVVVVEDKKPTKKGDVRTNPPEGWNVRPIPHLNTLTIEYECSSVAGEVFRTTDADSIGEIIQDIEDAKRKQPDTSNQITAGDVETFGNAFGLR